MTEAIVFGLPAVGSDLIACESYYPKGMIRVEKGNLYAFAKQVSFLLNNPKIRNNIGNEALKMLESKWSCGIRLKQLLIKMRTK